MVVSNLLDFDREDCEERFYLALKLFNHIINLFILKLSHNNIPFHTAQ